VVGNAKIAVADGIAVGSVLGDECAQVLNGLDLRYPIAAGLGVSDSARHLAGRKLDAAHRNEAGVGPGCTPADAGPGFQHAHAHSMPACQAMRGSESRIASADNRHVDRAIPIGAAFRAVGCGPGGRHPIVLRRPAEGIDVCVVDAS